MLRVFVICLTLSLPSLSAANTIVDTGPGTTNPFGFGNVVFTSAFAGKFTIIDSYVIQSIEGYFSNEYSQVAGTVDISIHDDGGSVPGAVRFGATTAPLAALAPVGWYGVFGLNQVLAPGTYWASFIPSMDTLGTMPGGVPVPLAGYAASTLGNPWISAGPINVGVRINGDRVTTTVPDSASTLSLLMCVALFGLAAQRLRS
jgi:hypothetical protein